MTDTAYNVVAKELEKERDRSLALFEENMRLDQENKTLKLKLEAFRGEHKKA